MARQPRYALSLVLLHLTLVACGRTGFAPHDERALGTPHASGPVTGMRPSAATFESPPAADPSPSSHTLFLGIQGSDGRSYVQALRLESDDTIEVGVRADVTDPASIRGDKLRVVADLPTGDLLLAGTSSNGETTLVRIDTTTRVVASITLHGELAPGNLHGACVLPNGNIIGGAFARAPDNRIVEISPDGEVLEEVVVPTKHLSDCVAADNDHVYLVDYDGMTDTFGIIREMVRTADGWTEVASLEVTTFGGSTGSSAYTILRHSNGNLYIPPHRPDGDRCRTVLECEGGDLAACHAIGSPLDIGSWTDNLVHGVVELPNGDLGLASNTHLFRFSLSTGELVELADLRALIPSFGQTRHMRLRPAQ